MSSSARINYYCWPVSIIAGLSIVVIVNIFMMRLALHGGSELTESQPYEAGLAFEQKLEELKRGVEMGVPDTLRISEVESDGLRTIEVTLPTAALKAADPAGVAAPRVVLAANYAAASSDDRQFELLSSESAPELFRTRAKLQRGAWQLSLYIEAGKTRVRASRTLLLE